MLFKLRYILLLFFCAGLTLRPSAQILPAERAVNWSSAGYTGIIPEPDLLININNFGAVGDGITNNDLAITAAIDALNNEFGILYVPAGNYKFSNTIILGSNIILRGAGADQTTLTFDLGGNGHLIQVEGEIESEVYPIGAAGKGENIVTVLDAVGVFSIGDYIRIGQDDSDLITSAWAEHTVGQIEKVIGIIGNKLILSNQLRKDFLPAVNPYIQRINPQVQTGVECLKISRADLTIAQTSNIYFNHTAESWVKGVESDHCNFAHVHISSSTNVEVRGSYFYDAFDYGGGGKAYGVMLDFTSGNCLVENNIFRHLRHSMVVQAGANGNIFGYNYSFDPFWTGSNFDENLAGDIVCHGNYPHSNLFEGNIAQNLVVDQSHGKNGPYNTFFRNRLEYYGIFNDYFSGRQNYIGNEITNDNDGLGTYLVLGDDHFSYNNNLGTEMIPSGAAELVDISYYLPTDTFPSFFNAIPSMWNSLGAPNEINTGTNPAQERYLSEIAPLAICEEPNLIVSPPPLSTEDIQQNAISIYPNPVTNQLSIDLKDWPVRDLQIFLHNSTGQMIHSIANSTNKLLMDLSDEPAGLYFISIYERGEIVHSEKLIKL